MFPGTWAERAPDRPAVIMAESGETVSYRQLDARSCQLAQLLWERGLRRGDHVAVMMENRPEFFEAMWAALRSGLCVTTINRYLTVEEAGYILGDCEAQALVIVSGGGAVFRPEGGKEVNSESHVGCSPIVKLASGMPYASRHPRPWP